MSKSNLLEDLEVEVEKFSDNPGLPEKEHEKKQAKAKATREKKNKSKVYPTYYTMKKGKILLLCVKPNGVYSTFIARQKMMGDLMFKTKVKEWSEKGQWFAEHEVDERLRVVLADVQAKAQQELDAEKEKSEQRRARSK